MYLINTTLTVNWVLLTVGNPPLLADLDIKIVPPDGTSSYLENSILAGNYTPSTISTKGAVSFDFIPNQLGLWEISLTEGTSALNRNFYTHKIIVSKNDTLIKKFVKSSLL